MTPATPETTQTSRISRISRNWQLFLLAAFVVGTLLRVLYVNDMEYKEDEEYNFTQSQIIGRTIPWPWFGIPSGVYLPNPGMSIWVFTWLARIAQATTPTELCRALQIFSLLGMFLVVPFVRYFVRDDREREPWLWALVLALVNPFHVVYERKLWPEGFLPFFSMLTFMGWWKRDRAIGAFVWGLVGAAIGQVHMSGFFLAAALFGWTVLFGRRLSASDSEAPRKTHWLGWLVGTLIGAAPLVPWAMHILAHPVKERVASLGWENMAQLKYWVFWLTDATGLTLGNPLGLLRSQSNLGQIADFARYPILGGTATYLTGAAHALLFALCALVMLLGLRWLARNFGKLSTWIGDSSRTTFVQNALLIGCGLLLTLTNVNIRRYYMVVTFPFEFILLARMALLLPRKRAYAVLGAIWACQAFISANFVGYVHVNEGATQGDYGDAYHVVMRKRAEAATPAQGVEK